MSNFISEKENENEKKIIVGRIIEKGFMGVNNTR